MVYHHTREDWKHLLHETSEELAFILGIKFPLLNFGLQISAASLVEAVKVKSHQNLLILLRENFLLELRLYRKYFLRGSFLILLIAAAVEHVVQKVEADRLELFHRALLVWLRAEYRAALLRLLEM